MTTYNPYAPGSGTGTAVDQEGQKGRLEAELKAEQEQRQKELDQIETDLAEITQSRRINEQCFLFDAMEFFAKKNENITYKHIIPVSGDPGTAPSRLTKVNNSDLFFELKPSAMAMLVPKIRLFLVKYRDEEDEKGIYQELIFEDHVTSRSVESIFQNRTGRGAGAGIKSFTYEFDGKDPATTQNMIKANLTLFFTDFDVISKPQRGLTAKERKHFKGSGLDKDYLKPRFLDLILRQKRHVMNDADVRVYNPKFYKVKAIIGWAVPPNNDSFDANDFFKNAKGKPSGRELKRLIRSMDLSLDLNMTRHNLDFKEDGRIELRIDYRAAIENSLSSDSADLLLPPKNPSQYNLTNNEKKILSGEASLNVGDIKNITVAKMAKGRKTLEQALKKNKEDLALRKEQIDENTVADDDIVLKLSTEIKRIQSLLRAAEDSRRSDRYKRLLEKIQSNGRILYADLDKAKMYKYFLAGPLGRSAAAKDRAESGKSFIAEQDDISKEAADATFQIQNKNEEANQGNSLKDLGDALDQQSTKIAQDFSAASKEPDIERSNASGIISNIAHRRDLRQLTVHPSVYRLNYIYLGDIIAAAASLLNENEDRSNIKIALGDFDYEVPMTTKTKNINLADVPISLDNFIAWYTNKVITKNRRIYYMKDFISDVMTDLVYSALGDSCFAGAGRQIPMISMIPLSTMPKKDGKKKVSVFATKRKGETVTFNRTSIKNLSKKMRPPTESSAYASPGNEEKFLFVYASGRARTKLTGNYRKDKKIGIPHFGIGQDAGPVKRIKFQRMDSKYLAEARIVDEQQAGLGQLYEKYNATVDLYGCPLFRNGQYVFLDATTMGVDREVAQVLGLGGYYVITSVDGELSRDGYQTSLKCTFNHSPILSKQAGEKTSKPKEVSEDRVFAAMNAEEERKEKLLASGAPGLGRATGAVSTESFEEAREMNEETTIEYWEDEVPVVGSTLRAVSDYFSD